MRLPAAHFRKQFNLLLEVFVMTEFLFLDLSAGEQRKILVGFKRTLKIPWVKMAQLLGVSKSMLFFYCNDSCKMPFRQIEKLCKITNSNIAQFQQLKLKEIPFCYAKQIKKPVLDERLAEFLGILSGDGCVLKSLNSTYVTCGAILDSEYVVTVVRPIFMELFGVSPIVRIQKGGIHCCANSKRLAEYLSGDCGFPLGEKKNKLLIPSWIFQEKSCSVSFLRGLFDTDGGVHRHHKNSIQIGFTSISPKFLSQVHALLKVVGFNPRLGKEDIWIFGNHQASSFFKIIAPKNPKHIFKYNQFLETGQVPLTRELLCGGRDSNPSHDLVAHFMLPNCAGKVEYYHYTTLAYISALRLKSN